MDRVKRIWYLSPMRTAKVQASLRIRAVSPEPSLLAHTSSESPSDRKPDLWPLWMAGHAQLKFVMTECSKTQIRLAGLILFLISYPPPGAIGGLWSMIAAFSVHFPSIVKEKITTWSNIAVTTMLYSFRNIFYHSKSFVVKIVFEIKHESIAHLGPSI